MTENEKRADGAPEQTPDEEPRTGNPTTEPRGNGPVDEEALEKAKETLERVKPY